MDVIESFRSRMVFSFGLSWGDGPGAFYSTLTRYWMHFPQGKEIDLGQSDVHQGNGNKRDMSPLVMKGYLVSA